jgi:hypothetical protein
MIAQVSFDFPKIRHVSTKTNSLRSRLVTHDWMVTLFTKPVGLGSR